MNILERISRLNLPSREFVVLGSGILEIKGIRNANDLDILVKKDFFGKLKNDKSWAYTKKIGTEGDVIDLLEKQGVELYFHVYGKHTFDYFMEDTSRTELIEGIYFSSLKDLLRQKKIWKREKDLSDIEKLETYLKTI